MVTENEVFEKIKEILTNTFEIDANKITMQAKLYDDLDIDSIDAVDMLVELKPFIGNHAVKPSEFKSVRTIGDVVHVITNLINS